MVRVLGVHWGNSDLVARKLLTILCYLSKRMLLDISSGGHLGFYHSMISYLNRFLNSFTFLFHGNPAMARKIQHVIEMKRG